MRLVEITKMNKGNLPGLRRDYLDVFPASATGSTGTLTLTTSYQNVPGSTWTVTTGGTWLIFASFSLEVTVVNPGDISCILNIISNNGVATTTTANLFAAPTAPARVVMPLFLAYGLKNGDTVTPQVKKGAGAGTATCLSAAINAICVGRTYQ